MAPREDLVMSAVTFLQDPSVASSSPDKRIAFLQSKNLTPEEIDLALAKANEQEYTASSQSPQQSPASYYSSQTQQQHRRSPPGYNPYNAYPEWQPPPPELPRRDWRDWFIMATVVGGASYGLWVLAQRYIKPLIAPPTPPQLEQDKTAIDEQFTRAFALLDTLSSDTTALKEAEEARTQRLDSTLAEVETVLAELKTANQRREDESRRMEIDVRALKDSIPRAIDNMRDGSEKRLKELGRELASLKLLMGNRFGSNPAPTPSTGLGMSPRQHADANTGAGSGADNPLPADDSSARPASANGANPVTFGSGNSAYYPSSAAASASRPRGAASPLGTSSGNKATIPAWQMAAANASKSKAAEGGGDGDHSSPAAAS